MLGKKEFVEIGKGALLVGVVVMAVGLLSPIWTEDQWLNRQNVLFTFFTAILAALAAATARYFRYQVDDRKKS